MTHTRRKPGSATVEKIDASIIYCKLQGAITEAIARSAMAQTRELIEEVRRTGQPAMLLLDISEVTSQDSGSRTAAKEIREFKLDKIAVYGGNRLLRMVGQYILRSGGMSDYGKVFATRFQAMRWLQQSKENASKRDIRLVVFWILLGIALAVSLAALGGWITDRPILLTIDDTHRAVNPVGALAIVLCVTCAPLLLVKKLSSLQRIIFLFFVLGQALFGASVVLRYVTNIELNADTWLFTDQLETPHHSARLSFLAGCMFFVIGIMAALIKKERPVAWQRTVLYIVSVVGLLIPLTALLGYSFGIPELYSIHDTRAITLPTILSTASIVIALLLLNAHRQPASKSRVALSHYWQGLVVFFSIVLLTGFTWQQAKNDINKDRDQLVSRSFNNTTDVISGRITAYVDALRGYQSFFAASQSVSPQEFSNYYKTFDLQNRYPGFTAVTFVREVPRDQLAPFVATVRKDFGDYNNAYKTFTPYPAGGAGDKAYPVTLIQPDTGLRSIGFDQSTSPERLTTLTTARDTGAITATGLINLNQSRPDLPRSNGFFLSIPIFTKDPATLTTVEARRANTYGMVNAVVNDDRLFSDVFKRTDTSNVQYTVATGASNTTVYQTKKSSHELTNTYRRSIDIAGQEWLITMRTSNDFGISAARKLTPYNVLFSGFLLASLAAALLISQTRRRDQALTLASKMTEDLQQERDNAVTLQQKDEAILSSIGDAVFAINTAGQITLFNQAAQSISGYSAHEAIGKSYQEILNFQNQATGKTQTTFITGALHGKTTSMKSNTILIRKDGTRVQVADSAAPIRNTRGDLQGVIVVFRDISKEYELDKAKTEFVSLASHQLRTPLSAINWYAELLVNGDAGKLPKDAKTYVTEIYEGNQRMIELVNALLDVSRLELGKLANNPVPTDMQALSESLHKELATSINEKQLDFDIKAQKKLPLVEGDPKFLRMIVQNLLSNAVKYTPKGGKVLLTMRTATEAERTKAKIRTSGPALFISVSDTGYGIPQVQQPKVFSKLFRADNVRALDVEGTGLGLYIVKEVAEKMGGKVWFTSQESIGTTFYIILPFKTKTVHT